MQSNKHIREEAAWIVEQRSTSDIGVDGDRDQVRLLETRTMNNEAANDPAHARTRIWNHYDDEWNENPKQVEELLSRELFKLSLQDRNNFEDEIHGVPFS